MYPPPNGGDRLSFDPLSWIEGSDGIVEGCDVGPQPTNPDPLDDITQLARSISREILLQAAALRVRQRLRTPNAIQMRTA